MSEDQKDCYIDYQADRVTNLDLENRAMTLVLEEFLNTHVYKMVRMMYNKTPKLFAFFQSVLFAINRINKKNNE